MRTITEVTKREGMPPRIQVRILSELCLQPLGVSATEAAEGIECDPQDVVGDLEWACRNQSGDGHPFFHRV